MANHTAKIFGLAMLMVSGGAFAMDGTPERNAASMGCPMAEQAAAMQKDLRSLVGEMDTAMKGASDPATMARMRAMRGNMTAMMAKMQMMGGGMMGGAPAPQGKPAPSEPKAEAAPPAADEDHEAHHPAQ